MSKKLLSKYNNRHWRYEETASFDSEWTLVQCYRVDGDEVEICIFHLKCLPPPKQFKLGFEERAKNVLDNCIGSVNFEGHCDKCGEGPINENYRKIGRFLFPDVYEESEDVVLTEEMLG